ncbi:MAG: PAS domain S-box protein [Luteolibacter sp.]|jgi:PAS domain S-box-containing protein|nr:PAS domain S-box protein [Luteolibacter sp.]
MNGLNNAAWFHGLLEAAPDAIVIVNTEGSIERINSQTERMFGYARDELLGQAVEILIPTSLAKSHSSHRAEYVAAPVKHTLGSDRTLRARRRDGTEFPADIRISPLHTGSGLLIISFIRDVTEHVRNEEVIRKLNSELEARVLERTNALRRANEKLHKEMAARRRLEKEILEISEREQQRIGRDLHDDLGQRLVGISYMSHLLASALLNRSSPAADQAGKITSLLNDALALTRSLARGLHPVAMKSGGLMAALADLAERTSGIFEVSCRFTGPACEPVLTDSVATHLYRIAQEAVTNAVNHGKATDILIDLASQAERTTLVVTDNGAGLPKPSPRRKGMGLRIMNYRADIISGSLAFSTPENGGTMVTCTLSHT